MGIVVSLTKHYVGCFQNDVMKTGCRHQTSLYNCLASGTFRCEWANEWLKWIHCELNKTARYQKFTTSDTEHLFNRSRSLILCLDSLSPLCTYITQCLFTNLCIVTSHFLVEIANFSSSTSSQRSSVPQWQVRGGTSLVSSAWHLCDSKRVLNNHWREKGQ